MRTGSETNFLISNRMIDGNFIPLLPQGVVIALFVWNIVLFSVALRRDFSRPDGVKGMMRVLALCGALAALTGLFLLCSTQLSLWHCIVGIGLLAMSQALLRAAVRATTNSKLSLAFSGDVPTNLNRSGPYRFIRHPFYTSYSLTWLAAAVASSHPAAFVALFIMAAFYLSAARQEERKFQSSSLAESYRQYRKSTGMFFPHPNLNPQQTNPTP